MSAPRFSKATPVLAVAAIAFSALFAWSVLRHSNRHAGSDDLAARLAAGARSSVGMVVDARGEAVLAAQSGEVIDLESTALPIRVGDAITTGNGTATLRLADGSEARLESQGRLSLEPALEDAASPELETRGKEGAKSGALGRSLLLHLESGALTTLRNGPEFARISILRRGQRYSWGAPSLAQAESTTALGTDARAAEAAATAFEEPSALPEEAPSPGASAAKSTADVAPIASNSSGAVSNKEIAEAMSSQAGFFKRCALAYLERQRKLALANTGWLDAPDASARAQTTLMSFTILPTGRAVEATGIGGEGDEPLKRCLADVIERVPFRRFVGSAIPISEYPVRIQ